MAGTTLWYRSFVNGAAASISAVLAKLRSVGLEPTALSDNATDCSLGLIFFDVVTQELFELLRDLSRSNPSHLLAVALSREALAGNAWRLLESGATDVLVCGKPEETAGDIAARIERWLEVDRLMDSPVVKNNLIGESPVWRATLRRLVEVARFSAAPVLLVGETGTGKELIARLIHTLDPRREKLDLITVDCTTIVSDLAGSEFFGHERGAFTSAVTAREGAFALAAGGTLFLDEVGELPPRLQAELLRVVQEHTFKRVGSNRWQTTSFRLISATNRDLEAEAERGNFRRDFYYRIAAWVCHVPPLRERVGDILTLANHFIRQLQQGDEPLAIDEPVRNYLLQRQYPGNVRDLKQLVIRIMTRHVGTGMITVGDVAEEERPTGIDQQVDWRDDSFENSIRRALALGFGLKEIAAVAAETAIRLAVNAEEGRGRVKRAAQRLGVTERALQMHRASRTR